MFICGAVPPGAGDADDFDWSLIFKPLSLRRDDGSSLSLSPGAAIEERVGRSIEVLGRRLLLAEAAFGCSALTFRTTICEPSRLPGR